MIRLAVPGNRRYAHAMAALLLLASTPAPATESIPGVDSHYRDITVSDGATLRTIVTLPEGDSSPRHPLLFTQWVSCGSIEYREGSNARELLAALARESGLALVRVERSAVSDGPSCEALDFDTEFEHYLDAFTELLGSDQVDADRIYVYGSSLGANMAPLVAAELQRRGHDIAGMIAKGGGAVTYLERMLAFDRFYLERRPEAVQPADIHDQLLRRVRFHYDYLVAGRHPDAIAGDNAAMGEIRNDILGLGESDHYGRPFAWHQQIAQRNFLAAWQEVEAPVLVIFNEFDQFETRHGHALIADVVNRFRPGTARLVVRSGVGHSDNAYPTIVDAYAFENGTAAWEDAAQIMTEWLTGLEAAAADTTR